MSRLFLSLSCLAVLSVGLRAADDETGTGLNFLPGNFEAGQATYNPWGGVNDNNEIQVIPGTQFAAGESGEVTKLSFSPSPAVGDLNGDGFPDLVVGDARGFFWYFPNALGNPPKPADAAAPAPAAGAPGATNAASAKPPAATPAAPAAMFTKGEVMPIWLYPEEKKWDGDVVPRIQLVDFTGDKKLSIVASNFAGQLFFIPNRGSATTPNFSPTTDLATLEIPTHTNKLLWCNYLAPFLFDWSGNGRLDMIMGDGSYSANSIYYFVNKGTNDRPVFREENMTRVIPGLGKEHLTPQVIDWNGDGKPDIIAGERTGYIDIYINQAATATDTPVFNDVDKAPRVMFGTTDRTGAFPTVCAADLNGDKLFDLVVGNADGKILYSLNIGTATAPKFGPLVPLKGVYPYTKTFKSLSWRLDPSRPYGPPFGLLETVNATTDPTFVPFPDFGEKGALKSSVFKAQQTVFSSTYQAEEMERGISFNSTMSLQTGVPYKLIYYVRSEGDISNLHYVLDGTQAGGKGGMINLNIIGDSASAGGSWTKVSQEIRIPTKVDSDVLKGKPDMASVYFQLRYTGNGTLYFNHFSLRKAR